MSTPSTAGIVAHGGLNGIYPGNTPDLSRRHSNSAASPESSAV